MASPLTDAEREHRYGVLRTKKNRCEKNLGICMWGLLLHGIFWILPAVAGGILNGVLLSGLLCAVIFAGGVYAIYAKRWQITLGVIAGCVLLPMLFASYLWAYHLEIGITVFLMILTLYCDIQWYKLSQEEGFPLFDISYREREEIYKAQGQIIHNRAVQAGAQIADPTQRSDMGDLLDAGHETPVIPPQMHNYQARGYENSTSAASAAPQMHAQPRAGVMDTLESFAAPAAPQAEMQDIPAIPSPPQTAAPMPAAPDMSASAAPTEPETTADPETDDEIRRALQQLSGK